MAKRIIVKDGDPLLRKKSRDVTVFDSRLHQLLDDMLETMEEANGVGLAAVQVGILRRAVIIRVEEELYEFINPKITAVSPETITLSEGCLSFPGRSGMVTRPAKVTVEAQNRNGDFITVTGEDMVARAFCHEIDHTNGIVFIDLATDLVDEDLEDQE